MHLQAVFILIYILRHPVELSSLVKIGSCDGVNRKIAQWCSVMSAFCQSCLLKVEVM